jgi:hypothetical protein
MADIKGWISGLPDDREIEDRAVESGGWGDTPGSYQRGALWIRGKAEQIIGDLHEQTAEMGEGWLKLLREYDAEKEKRLEIMAAFHKTRERELSALARFLYDRDIGAAPGVGEKWVSDTLREFESKKGEYLK